MSKLNLVFLRQCFLLLSSGEKYIGKIDGRSEGHGKEQGTYSGLAMLYGKQRQTAEGDNQVTQHFVSISVSQF